MPYYIIERNYAEQIHYPIEGARELNLINDEEDVRWLYSFLSVDRRKSYCLYEAPSMEAIRAAAVRAGMPADVITEVDGRVMPSGAPSPLRELVPQASPRSRANIAAWVRFSAPIFVRMLRTWFAAVCSLITSRVAMSRLLRPSAMSAMTSHSRAVSPPAI